MTKAEGKKEGKLGGKTVMTLEEGEKKIDFGDTAKQVAGKLKKNKKKRKLNQAKEGEMCAGSEGEMKQVSEKNKRKSNNKNKNKNKNKKMRKQEQEAESSLIFSTTSNKSATIAPSFKARQTPTLAFKMHKLSQTYASGIGADTSTQHGRALGQGKRKVWIGPELSNVSESKSRPRVPPIVESRRVARLMGLRKQFLANCGSIVPPVLAFERWLLDNMLHADEQKLQGDPLLALATASSTATLVCDLVRASTPQAEAKRIAQTLSLAAAKSSAAMQAPASPQLPSPTVVVTAHKHTRDVCLHGGGAGGDTRLFKLNHEHYHKLLALWRLARGDSVALAQVALDEGSDDETAFHSDLYSLLARYFSIQGHGFQAACPESVFAVLQSRLGVHHECFASPMNCYFGSYCSAFPDTDTVFGSAGSFWHFEIPPEGGSFQANPPFVASLMAKMAVRIETLLQSTKAPLSFTVVVPGWLEDEGYRTLIKSEHCRARWMVSKADHGFCDGAQHQRQDRFRESPFDTAVFVLQNEAGSMKWAVHEDTEAELRKAFATGVPTPAMVARRLKEGRGFADQDGGGGVYKGKSKNKRKRE